MDRPPVKVTVDCASQGPPALYNRKSLHIFRGGEALALHLDLIFPLFMEMLKRIREPCTKVVGLHVIFLKAIIF